VAAARGERWSPREIEAAVADYFDMLQKELRGEPFVKAHHVQALATKLNGRTRQSIEMRHQNISAALRRIGWPWIDGYKPLDHSAMLVLPYVERCLAAEHEMEALVSASIEGPNAGQAVEDRVLEVVEPPASSNTRLAPLRRPKSRVNYLELAERNARVGRAGEDLVLDLERRRLVDSGRPDLARRIEHVSLADEAAGFDVLSYDDDAKERFIEVKTTVYGAEAPFFVSRNEREVSIELSRQYQLYRVFRLWVAPKVFMLRGSLDTTCHLEPESYRARVA
jgi:hypothetical protein